jgi:plasmid stabilization system protein ParE
MRVRFLDEAEAEAQAAHDYYAQSSLARGAEFEAELWRRIQTIQRYPESGHLLVRQVRRVVMSSFPYSIFYRVIQDRVVLIVAVAHFRQEWGYWFNRLN